MEETILRQLGGISVASRSVRTAFCKMRKTVDILLADNAHLRSQLASKDVELEALKPRTRKRVKIGGNERFASLAEIVAAKDASLEPPRERRTAAPTIQPEIVARAQEMLTTGSRPYMSI
ncbi:hypothetical protein QBC46DRAFT_398793 [Diplogelasinospora grovesii]|uniref:Uncharacterized protein n=1 Tax=Diplogelasinospora grovesii TaxID=303347 RepID=A0AAN6MXV8_9PEZI|nr:hypothetical protein QBC46DRAFT_398793 [Diplogelasinospora grovesii]